MKLRLTLLLLCALSIGAYSTYNYLTSWKWHFKQSPSLVFYSLHSSVMLPHKMPHPIDKLPGFVMDKVVVSARLDKEELIDATAQALTRPNPAIFSHCFAPRHAVATADGQTTILICFGCNQAKVITPQSSSTVPVYKEVRPIFDALIRKYGLKAEKVD